MLGPSALREFLKAQSTVLTKALYLEKGGEGEHQTFAQDELVPLESKGLIGSGGYGKVDKVLSMLSHKEYARKRISRGNFLPAPDAVEVFTRELKILKRVKHHHVVELVGSYTDPNHLNLIMSPVADCDLAYFLSEIPDSVERKSLLRTFFGCLSAALLYLHDSQIRHKDIKPQNILVKGDAVLLTDFGISLDCSDLSNSTTSGSTAKSPLYCAPEVAALVARNFSSDIWSLGCVFLEIASVVKGKTVDDVRSFFEENGSNSQFYHSNLAAISQWIAKLGISRNPDRDNMPFEWSRKMLQQVPSRRPNARAVFENLRGSSPLFCGTCCTKQTKASRGDGISAGAQNDLPVRKKFVAKKTPEIFEEMLSDTKSESPLADDRLRTGTPLTVSGSPNPHLSVPGAATAGQDEQMTHCTQDIESNGSWGAELPPLHEAAISGCDSIVKFLIERGEDINATTAIYGFTPLLAATFRNRVTVVELLLESGADASIAAENGTTALNLAVESGSEAMTRLLLKGGSDVMVRDRHGYTPLHQVAFQGNPEIARALIESGADITAVDNLGNSVLHCAACRGHDAALRVFLENGADINGVNEDGWNPLHSAAWRGSEAVVRTLVERGQDIEVEKDGWTPLHIAAAGGHEGVLSLLLEMGADVRATNKYGRTPLLEAIGFGQEATAKILFEIETSIGTSSKRDSVGALDQQNATGAGPARPGDLTHTAPGQKVASGGLQKLAKTLRWKPLHRHPRAPAVNGAASTT